MVEQRIEAVLGGHQCDGNIGRLPDGKLIVDLSKGGNTGGPPHSA